MLWRRYFKALIPYAYNICINRIKDLLPDVVSRAFTTTKTRLTITKASLQATVWNEIYNFLIYLSQPLALFLLEKNVTHFNPLFHFYTP